ncbi:unnamed protein product (macronuclear) [Paramecium tetraurelia]|uniref:Palmitoyltransferase n=1 Tax=Paramecium tetraurelia TaxID=5888 RepID=A0C9R1_PARTE|nr:uncharacterized protein GSPATT00006835001 [Paramecium tetraurelia]CAK67528.1 unnamed protein product [Paramecium tetraurelia]|eukprot:XP_001434925.1 hypothetical protein (macronuclear) [Paramecium tetraurelia strain d4-2]
MKKILHFFEEVETTDSRKSFEAFTRCKGNIIFGAKNDLPNIIGTFFLIVAIIMLYLIFIFPAALDYQYNALAIIIAICCILPITTLLNVTMTEPGVLLKGDLPDPKQQQQQQTVEELESTTQSNKNFAEVESIRNGSNHILLVEGSQNQIELNLEVPSIYKVRYCSTCKIMRPSKASHCKFCNHCVEGFDHHCFWVGTCIGIRNQRAFLIFLQSSLIVAILTFCQCSLNLYHQYLDIYNLWILMFKEASIPIIVIYGIYFCCGCWTQQSYLNVIIIMIMFILPIIYSAVLINIEDAYKDYRYYDNPFLTFLVTIILLVCCCFLLPFNSINCYYISLGKTAKQQKSEDQFYIKKQSLLKTKHSSSEVFQNLVKFYTSPIPISRNQ